jgi:hypothetical protein
MDNTSECLGKKLVEDKISNLNERSNMYLLAVKKEFDEWHTRLKNDLCCVKLPTIKCTFSWKSFKFNKNIVYNDIKIKTYNIEGDESKKVIEVFNYIFRIMGKDCVWCRDLPKDELDFGTKISYDFALNMICNKIALYTREFLIDNKGLTDG